MPRWHPAHLCPTASTSWEHLDLVTHRVRAACIRAGRSPTLDCPAAIHSRVLRLQQPSGPDTMSARLALTTLGVHLRSNLET